jgi:hypothetical protein
LCFDTNLPNAPADECYYLAYSLEEPFDKGDGTSARAAYALASKPTDTSAYEPAAAYQYNEFGTGKLTVQRTSMGHYNVTIPGTPSYTTATALVTAVGTDSAYCTVTSWLPIAVACYQADGSPEDTKFAVTFQAH